VTRALIVALVLRVGLVGAAWTVARDPQVFHAPDTGSYLRPAQTLWEEGTFGPRADPEIVRTPGYPVLLMPGLAAGQVEGVTLALQIALSLLSVVLVGRIGAALASPEAGARAALLYALEPLSILYVGRLLTETLFTTALLVFLAAAVAYVRRPSGAALLTAAPALAAATYVRPIALALAPVLAGLWALRLLRVSPKDRPAWIQAALFLLIAAGLPGLWLWRNAHVAGYAGMSAIGDVNLYFYHAAELRAHQEGVAFSEMQTRWGYRDPQVYFAAHPDQRALPAGRRFEAMRAEALDVLGSDVGRAAALYARGIARTLLSPGATEYLQLFGLQPTGTGLLSRVIDRSLVGGARYLLEKEPRLFWSELVGALILAAYGTLALRGLLRRAAWSSAAALLPIVVAAYLLWVAGGPAAYHRFRHPIMPIVCLLAAWPLATAARDKA
jgi:hypothetical protein